MHICVPMLCITCHLISLLISTSGFRFVTRLSCSVWVVLYVFIGINLWYVGELARLLAHRRSSWLFGTRYSTPCMRTYEKSTHTAALTSAVAATAKSITVVQLTLRLGFALQNFALLMSHTNICTWPGIAIHQWWQVALFIFPFLLEYCIIV